METATEPIETPSAPTDMTTWPGAFGAYKISSAAVMRSMATNIWIWVISFGGTALFSYVFKSSIALVVLDQILAAVLAAFITGARIQTTVQGVRGKRIELADALRTGSIFTLRLFVLNVLVGLSVAVGLLLLIIPGLIILPRLSFATFYMVDKKMGIIQSYKASWHATKGHAMEIWGIYGVMLLIFLPVITIVGILLTIYWYFMYGAVSAAFYQHLLDGPKSESTAS
jgi:hypothetical protein